MWGLVIAVVVSAQPTEGKAQAKAKAQVAELFNAAKKLFAQRQYADAIVTFQAAYDAGKDAVVLYNIGKCHERLKDSGKALRYFREYQRLDPRAQRDDRLKGDLANAERRLKAEGRQQIVIFADPPGAEVTVDQVPQQQRPVYVELDEGEHVFVVRAEGYETQERHLKTPLPGGSGEQSFILRPGPAAVPGDAPKDTSPAVLVPLEWGNPIPRVVVKEKKERRPRLWTWVAAGAAVAAGGTAIGLGVAYDGANRDLHTFNSGRHTLETTAAEKQAVGLATATNVAIGVTAAAAITGVVLFFVEGR